MSDNKDQNWCVSHAREFYNIPIWGEGYYDVNSLGHIVAKLDAGHEIDLYEVIQQLSQQGVSLPVLLRFPQILQARVKQLCSAFELAASQNHYPIQHTPVYPIKVNQQKSVVKHILSSDVRSIGLEVGTKTELLAALGLMQATGEILICNGYKDRAYIRLAVFAHDMGIQTYCVVESYSELSVIIEESQRLNIQPVLGVRVRLNTIAAGKWQNSGGCEAKFGLSAKDLLNLMQTLKQHDWIDNLKLLHFHMGSQISNLDDFKLGTSELMSLYREFYQQQFTLDILDIGGGVAVDYSSTQDTSYFSKAYDIETYAQTVIESIGQYCEQEKLPFPNVFTENGRALTAHHAALVTNVVDVELAEQPAATEFESKDSNSHNSEALGRSAQYIRHQIEQLQSHAEITEQDLQDMFKLCAQKFMNNEINLQERVTLEGMLRTRTYSTSWSDKYYVNLSIFQSLPDAWGLDQIFPVTPITQLDVAPTQQVILHDLTCDSDGHLAHYPYAGEIHESLPLHAVDQEQYLLGFFLVGAYQEVLGDMHNLFGDTHAVNVTLRDDELHLSEFEVGDCVYELLSTVHIDANQVVECCSQRMQINHNSQWQSRLDEIRDALHGYTYLDSMGRPAQRIKD